MKAFFMGITISFLLLFLSSCSPLKKSLIVSYAPWPNFEFIFLAEQKEFLDLQKVSIVELGSTTDVYRAFELGKIDVAFLPLDAVLRLIKQGSKLKIVSIIDGSIGADSLIVKPVIKNMGELKGKSIGFEALAPGTLVLNEFLTETDLTVDQVQLHEVKQNEALQAYLNNNIDAVIVRDPQKQKLIEMGGVELLNSSEIKDKIIHVVIVQNEILEQKKESLINFLKGYYKAYDHYLKEPTEALAIMSTRLQINPQLLAQAFSGTKFVTNKQALFNLSGAPSKIELEARILIDSLFEKNTVDILNFDLKNVITTSTLERVIYE